MRGRPFFTSLTPLVLFSMVILAATADGVQARPPGPIARIEVSPRVAIVGSPMELKITLLVPTWFTSAPDYPSLEVAGLIVRRPPDSSYNARETVAGVTYSGIVRDYQIYPQRAATYLLENLVVEVEYAHPDTRKPVAAALKLRPIRFEGTIPASASLLDPFLATSRLVLEQKIEGTVDELEVGDSIKRTITVRARDLPAMFIPPLFPDGESPSGLRAYPQSPSSQDLPGRDSDHTIGRRTESVTYVMEEPGDYTLPVLELRWWNRRTGRIETAEAPAISFQVSVLAAAAGMDDDRASAATGGSRDRLMRFGIATGMVLVLIALMVRALRRPARRLFQGWAAWRRGRAASEPVRYRQLRRLARRGKPHDIYQALAVWLGSIEGPPVNLASLSDRPGCRAFAQTVATLERSLYADDAGEKRGLSRDLRASLCRGLPAARDSIVHSRETRVGVDSLPALNPTNPG
jgi:hypothetical protein